MAGKTNEKPSKIAGSPETPSGPESDVTGATSGVMAPGPVGRAARDAVHAATNDPVEGESLRERALVDADGEPRILVDEKGEPRV